MPIRSLPTSLVGSYAQPDWLINRPLKSWHKPDRLCVPNTSKHFTGSKIHLETRPRSPLATPLISA